MTDLSTFLRSLSNKKGRPELITLSGCEVCGDAHPTKSCPLLAEAKHVQDSQIPSRARLTLPPNLQILNINNGTSVIAQTDFNRGAVFGPLQALHSTALPEGVRFPLKIFGQSENDSYYLNTSEEDSCNWMCLVSPAASADEQNLICYQMNEKIFFILLKDIKAGEELKVWYAPLYAVRMVSSAYKTALNNSNKKSNLPIGDTSEGHTVYSTKHKMKKNREKKLVSDTLLDTEIMQKVAEQLPAKRLGACRVPEKWRCRKCGSEETSVVAYAKHLMKHFKPAFSDTVKPIQCHLCKKTFDSEKLLVKHKVMRHGAVVQRPVLLGNIREEDTGDGQSSALDKVKDMDKHESSQTTNVIEMSSDENSIKGIENKTLTLYTEMMRPETMHNLGNQNVPAEQACEDSSNPLVSNTITEHDAKAMEFISEHLKEACNLTLDDIKTIAAVKDNMFAQELLKIINEKPSHETTDILASNNNPNSGLKSIETANKMHFSQKNVPDSTKYDFELRDLEEENGILSESGKSVPEISSLSSEKSDCDFLIISSNENKLSERNKAYEQSTSQFQLDSNFSGDQELCLHQPSSSLNAVVVPENGHSYQLILNENCTEGSEKELECTSISLSKCDSDKVAESVIHMLETDWELVTGSDEDSSAFMGIVSSSDKHVNSPSTSITPSSSMAKCALGEDKFPFDLNEVNYPTETIQAPKSKSQMSDVDCSSMKTMEGSSDNDEQSEFIAVSFNLDDVAMMPSDGSCTSYMFNLNKSSNKEELVNFSTNNISFEEKEQISLCNDKNTSAGLAKLTHVTEDISENTQDLSTIHSESIKCVSNIPLKISEEEHQQTAINREGSDCTVRRKSLNDPQGFSSQNDTGIVEIANENCGSDDGNKMKQNPKNIVTSPPALEPDEKRCHLNSSEDNFDSSNQSFFEAVFNFGITSNCLEKFPKNNEEPSDRSNSLMKDLDTVLLGDNVQDSQISSDKKQETCDSNKKHYVLDTGPPYNCDICDKEFHKAIYLYRHLKKHAGEFVCVSCLTVFARKENLINHSCFGDNKSKFLVCTFCRKNFRTKLMLRKHMVKHIAGGFSCKKYLNRCSEQTDTGNQAPPQPKPLQCPICRREFRYRNLCRHLQQHGKLRPCRCCGRSLPGNITLHEAYCSQDNILQSGEEAECPDCKKKFSDVVFFRLHVFQHTHPYICQTCKQAFRSDKDKCSHQCEKWSEKCPMCPQELSSLVELEQHVVSHELPQFHCFDCGRSFFKPDALFAHACEALDTTCLLEEKKVSKPKNSLICEVCGEVFLSNASLSNHKQLHGEPKFRCEICHKIFQRSDTLHAHLAVHREAQIPCPVCQKKVKTKKSLAVHLRQHTGTHLFKCDQCGKGFNQKINLNKHLQVHEDIDKRKQMCRYCDKTFISQDSLKIHELKHTQGQPHSCPLCNKAFVKEHQLRNHIKRLHASQILPCPFCPLTFKHRNSLSRHLERRHVELRAQWDTPNFLDNISAMTQESLSCPYCSQTFKNNNSLYYHLEKSHGDNRTEWSIPSLLQTVTVAPQDTEDLTGIPQGTEILLTVSDLPVSVENNQPETLTSQHIPESESQNSTNIAVENAFILEDGTIIQGTGQDVGQLVLYVLDNEDVCMNPELQSI